MRAETLNVPLFFNSHRASTGGVSTLISEGGMSQTALYSHVVDFAGGTGPTTGLSSICNGATGPAEGAVLSATAQGFLQVPDFRTRPPGLAPHPQGVVFRVHWVVNAIDGEDDRRDCSIDAT